MTSLPESVIQRFLNACHRIDEAGLLRCSSGNLSLRLDTDRFLITASRSWLGRITANQLCVCRTDDARIIEGARASVESGFHAGILRARPEIDVVLHFQSPAATTLACRTPGSVNYAVIPEIPFYLGPIATVPYHPPGSPELANAVIAALTEHDVANLANHGQVTVAQDLDHALQNAAFFELACEIILHGGPDISPLPADAIAELHRQRGASTGAA